MHHPAVRGAAEVCTQLVGPLLARVGRACGVEKNPTALQMSACCVPSSQVVFLPSITVSSPEVRVSNVGFTLRLLGTGAALLALLELKCLTCSRVGALVPNPSSNRPGDLDLEISNCASNALSQCLSM